MAPRPPPPRPAAAPAPVGAMTPAQTGNRLAVTATGTLVMDADSGALIAADALGRVTATRPIARNAGLLVYDPQSERAYVADRMNDQIVVVDVRDGLAIRGRWKTPAEPFGIALTPDRKTVIVTTIADHALVALDAATGAVQWRAGLSSGPRGVSIAPGGTLALVSSVATGSLELVELTGEHRAASIPFDLACERCQETGAVARGTGSVQFIDHQRAIATFQRSIPEALIDTATGRYGGGSRPPVTQHVAMLTFSSDPAQPGVAQRVARIAEHQPRAFVWDAALDTVYVAGFGSDTLLMIKQFSSPETSAVEAASENVALGAMGRCGPDGAALTANGELVMWCAFNRSVLRLANGELRQSEPLVASAMTPGQHLGMVLFYGTHNAINRDRALACSSCHTEGGSDGLSWRIGPDALQTPALAGRLYGTHPYKWGGTDATLGLSFATTTKRLGGRGLSQEQTDALAEYLTTLPAARAPTRDAAAIARGRAVFEGPGGCATCHSGTTYSDGEPHALSALVADTPSLVGLAASAPYYHDGSAPTLGDLIDGLGSVRGMGELASLTTAQKVDLRTFLESL